MVGSLFLPAECIVHTSIVGNMVREKRHLFLHKGCWHRFKGYAYSQLAKMETKSPEPGSKRAATVEQYGFDCYVESETEFLTDSGWRHFDEIKSDTQLATVNPKTGKMDWQFPVAIVDKLYTGPVYIIEPSMSRCVVTPGHQILVSPAHRNPKNNFSTNYDETHADWSLQPLDDLAEGYRSWFHTRRAPMPQMTEYPVTDDYLKLAGMFVSDGTVSFRRGKIKDGRLYQTTNGQKEFYIAADSLGLTRYTYTKESQWRIPRALAEQLYCDFGHGSHTKRLPTWCFQLSYRQVELLFYHLWLGDGTDTLNGAVYYTANPKLADDIQAMLTAAGHLSTVRGPYRSFSALTQRESDEYQVYRSHESHFNCVDFKRIDKPCRTNKQGNSIVRQDVSDCRVVCFTVSNGTLITRSEGKVAIHGNCKFACHLVRLMYEVEQILTTGDLDLRRNSEELKSIRRGEWTAQQIREFFVAKEKGLEAIYEACEILPWGPREDEIKQLLLDCLEEHYGSLEGCIVTDMTPVLALREIADVLDRHRNLLR